MPSLLRYCGKRRAVFGLLAQRLVVQDHAADVVGGARGGEQHFAIGAARFFGRLQLDAVEALLDRAARLVGRQNALAFRDHRLGGGLEFTAIHTSCTSCELLAGGRQVRSSGAAGDLRARRIANSSLA